MYVHVPTFPILINLLTLHWSNDDTPVHPSIQWIMKRKNRVAVYHHSVPEIPNSNRLPSDSRGICKSSSHIIDSSSSGLYAK